MDPILGILLGILILVAMGLSVAGFLYFGFKDLKVQISGKASNHDSRSR